MFDFLSNDNALLEAEKKYRDDGVFTVEQLSVLEHAEAMANERWVGRWGRRQARVEGGEC